MRPHGETGSGEGRSIRRRSRELVGDGDTTTGEGETGYEAADRERERDSFIRDNYKTEVWKFWHFGTLSFDHSYVVTLLTVICADLPHPFVDRILRI